MFKISSRLKHIKNFLKGIVIGIATLVPGVSGGTMAVILGVYDDIIHAIGSFFENWKKHTVLLFEIGLGGLFSLIFFSRLLSGAITRYPQIMQFLFMGVIIGGLPVLYRKSTACGKRNYTDFIFLVIGFLSVLLMSSETSSTATMASSGNFASLVFLFIAGIVLAIALILPGISGSYMLLVLGLLPVTLNAINTLNILFLIPLGLGLIAGTLGTAKAIEKLLQKYPRQTYMMIMGFVIGSLIPVFPGIPAGLQILTSAAAFIIGLLVILWVGKKDIAD